MAQDLLKFDDGLLMCELREVFLVEDCRVGTDDILVARGGSPVTLSRPICAKLLELGDRVTHLVVGNLFNQDWCGSYRLLFLFVLSTACRLHESDLLRLQCPGRAHHHGAHPGQVWGILGVTVPVKSLQNALQGQVLENRVGPVTEEVSCGRERNVLISQDLRRE